MRRFRDASRIRGSMCVMKRTTLLVTLLISFLSLPALASAESRFQVRCKSTHVASVDPIVAPGRRSEHEHEFFGNRSTNKDSTYRSMQRGATRCSTKDDTAGYWTPTLFRQNGSRVRAPSLLIYYRGEQGEHTRPFPRDLRMISHRFKVGPDPANLIVKFPECWTGERTDSRDHMRHMAFATGKGCPATHPVRVPALTEVFRYPVRSVARFHLSSGPLSTGHADFWNTWDQKALAELVARCLNRKSEGCGRIDS